MIFFCADTHFGHKNLVKGQTTWDDNSGCRDFKTVDEMNQALVDNINKVVKPNDHLYHAGDWAFGRGDKNIIEFREQINCKNIFLFTGNHDYRIQSESSELRKLFTKVRLKGSLRINGQDVVINHFPELIWDKHHHGAIHLYGHCHNSLNSQEWLHDAFHSRKCMDIGIDTHPEFRPYHFDEIMKIMSTKEVKFIDHHTNRSSH